MLCPAQSAVCVSSMQKLTTTSMHEPALSCTPSTTYLGTQTGLIPQEAQWVQQAREEASGEPLVWQRRLLFLPCQYRPKCFHVDCSPPCFYPTAYYSFPHIADSILAFYCFSVLKNCPFPSLLFTLLQPEASPSWDRSHLLGSGTGPSLSKTPSRGLGCICISVGDE